MKITNNLCKEGGGLCQEGVSVQREDRDPRRVLTSSRGH